MPLLENISCKGNPDLDIMIYTPSHQRQYTSTQTRVHALTQSHACMHIILTCNVIGSVFAISPILPYEDLQLNAADCYSCRILKASMPKTVEQCHAVYVRELC